MTSSVHAHGTLLQLGDAASPTEAFTTISEVLDIGGPEISADPIDVTNHSSPNGWRERIAGLKDGGEITFDLNLNPADATHSVGAGVLKDLVDGAIRNFKIIFPDTTEWIFPMIVTNFGTAAPVDAQLTAAVTLMAAGEPTLA